MQSDLHLQPVSEISYLDVKDKKDWVLLDVRSPLEYEHSHIPHAVNLPLLENTERETIGIIYKSFGSNQAIDEGYRVLESKKEEILKSIQSLEKNKSFAVYCARGGLRSHVVSALLQELGYLVKKIHGGYKEYRRLNLKRLDEVEIPELVLLCGRTGVGKTLVLDRLDNALDLEGLAGHKGSMFGAIGSEPKNQKTFEALLWERLDELDLDRPVFVEGESRRIGPVFVPNKLFRQMKKGRVVLLEASIETRCRRTVDEYIDRAPEQRDELRRIIFDLKPDLGKKKVAELIGLFDEGNFKECFKIILEDYYDGKYDFSVQDLKIHQRISTEDIDEAAQRITKEFGVL